MILYYISFVMSVVLPAKLGKQYTVFQLDLYYIHTIKKEITNRCGKEDEWLATLRTGSRVGIISECGRYRNPSRALVPTPIVWWLIPAIKNWIIKID